MKLPASWFYRCRFILLSAILLAAPCLWTQPQTAAPNSDKSRTATSQTSGTNTASRTTESHNKSGDRTVDKKSVELRGVDGSYQPYLDTETETVQVNATTTRTVVRTYGRDSNGHRSLTQVTEEVAQSSTNGDGKLVRTTSNPDLNGSLQVVQREVSDTRKTGPDVQETKTTVYMPQGGSMTPVQQTQEVQKRSGGGNVDVKTTTLIPDGTGKWQVGEVKENTIKEEGKNRSSQERVSRPDSEGKLEEISRTAGREAEGSNQQKTNRVETYTKDIPGFTGDGKLHLNQRVTTVQKKDAAGGTTEQQVEQPNPGAPDAGLRVTSKTIDIVRSGASGTQSTTTIQMRDDSGSFNVVSVDTRKSDQVPAQPVQIAPAEKAAPEKAKTK
ncbi:MAG TPA: hypothetical protein VN868_07130 [Terriglobales bacterium]|jgi:hypothetical protein|nr:hypothetical protein [Terriglobales bacterium]